MADFVDTSVLVEALVEWAAHHAACAAGVRGGAIYDFLILKAARQADASRVLTLNLKDFMPLARGLVVMAPS